MKKEAKTGWAIPLSAPHLTGNEWERLARTELNDIPLFPGQVEQAISQLTGAMFVHATPSGTSALELALHTLGIETGDWVICPTFTFSATANAILNTKATPVFVGAEPTTWGLDPDALETALRALKKRPKAIIVVDLYGMPARWADLQAVADRFDVPLVADAAESLGSGLNGRTCGTFGLLNAFSFNQNKIITGWGGGALLTDNPHLSAKAGMIANHGRQIETPFEQLVAGGNYRINPIAARLICHQLPMLSERIAKRRNIYDTYYRALNHLPGISFQPEPPEAFSNRWLTSLVIDPKRNGTPRDQLAQFLTTAQVETRPVFWPLHRQYAYRDYLFYGSSLAEELAQTGLCLPSGSGLSLKQIERVIDLIQTKLGCHP